MARATVAARTATKTSAAKGAAAKKPTPARVPAKAAAAKKTAAPAKTARAKAAPTPAQVAKGAAQAAARAVAAPAKTTRAKPAAVETPVAAARPHLVRDSFTMPEQEYAVLGAVKQACLKAGFEVKKSELLRIGVALLGQLDTKSLRAVLDGLPQLKTGRPPAG
jgi:hypothetical protein